MDQRARILHGLATRRAADTLPAVSSAGSVQYDLPRSSLAGFGRDGPVALQTVPAPRTFTHRKDTTSSTPLRQSPIKREKRVQSGNHDDEARLWQTNHADSKEEEDCSPIVVVFRIKDGVVSQQRKRSRDFSTYRRSTRSKATKTAVDPKPLSATSAFLPDTSPVDDLEYEMPLHVRLLSFLNRHEVLKTEKPISSSSLIEPPPQVPAPTDYSARYMTLDRFRAECAMIGRTDNTPIDFVTKIQAHARGYIIRKNVDTFLAHHAAASRIQAAWFGFKPRNSISRLRKRRAQHRPLECAPEADSDRVLQLERRIDQEIKSRKTLEGRFEEEVRFLQERVDFMQGEIDLYKGKLETAETVILSLKDAQCEFGERLDKTERRAEETKKNLEHRVKVLEQMAEKEAKTQLGLERRFEKVQVETPPQQVSQLVIVQHHHPSGSKPARSFKENSTPLSSIKPALADPPINAVYSRTPRAIALDRLAAKSNVLKVVNDQTKPATAGAPPSVLVSRASLGENMHAVLGPAKSTTNVRTGRSKSIRKEPNPPLPTY